MTFFWIDGPVFHCFFSQINSICSKNARFIVRWSAFSRFPNLFLLFLLFRHFRVAFPTVSNLFYTSVSLSGEKMSQTYVFCDQSLSGTLGDQRQEYAFEVPKVQDGSDAAKPCVASIRRSQ